MRDLNIQRPFDPLDSQIKKKGKRNRIFINIARISADTRLSVGRNLIERFTLTSNNEDEAR